jgi:predicted alpha/beta-fold hydrolase
MAGSGAIGSGGASGRHPVAGVPAGDYRAPAWLPGAHAQTIWPALLGRTPAVAYRRERWSAPDGDFVDLDHAARPAGAPPARPAGRRPHLALFHGLEGDSGSHYARALMAEAIARGCDGTVIHFRGCSGELNVGPRAYHSGASDEADWVLRRLRAARDATGRRGPLLAAGVSLGGNVLLKWLGERGADAGFVAAAAAVSPPHDLHASAIVLSRGFNRLYGERFLRTLRRKALAMLERHPGLYDRARVAASRDFFDFDELVTAPLNGFASALDYWTRSSCRQYLPGVAVPTLVLNALNDPFLPASALAGPHEVSRAVRLEYPAGGGHVGFLAGAPPGRLDWMPRRLFAHYEAVLGAPLRRGGAAAQPDRSDRSDRPDRPAAPG